MSLRRKLAISFGLAAAGWAMIITTGWALAAVARFVWGPLP
jgi:hypothetical protein